MDLTSTLIAAVVTSMSLSSPRKNMLTGAGWVSSRLERAGDAYVARAVPRAEPVKVSQGTRETLERVKYVLRVLWIPLR
jgi:hypothetical protein